MEILVRFFPFVKRAKIRSEIVSQKQGESLYSTWERFKGPLRDCPHPNQTIKSWLILLLQDFIWKQKQWQMMQQVVKCWKSFDEIYAFLSKFSKSNPEQQGESGRHKVHEATRYQSQTLFLRCWHKWLLWRTNSIKWLWS